MCLQHGTVPAPGSSEDRCNFELGVISGMVGATEDPNCMYKLCKLFRYEENSFGVHSFDEMVALWVSSSFQTWSVDAHSCSLVV